MEYLGVRELVGESRREAHLGKYCSEANPRVVRTDPLCLVPQVPVFVSVLA
jgi:hypothetical protein